MTTFQDIYYASLEAGLCKVKPRARDDLPEEIRGPGALWMQPGKDKEGNTPPPSYHTLSAGVYHPVEYVNRAWHWLEWDDTPKYRGYWTKPGQRIEQGQFELGWPKSGLTSHTPKETSDPALFSARDRAESGSTQPQEPAEEEADNDDDDEGVDLQPAQTEHLAGAFEQHTGFADIAEEIGGDEDQSRLHYLPTTLPSTTHFRPVGINPIRTTANPIRVRSSTTGTTRAPTTDATQLITNAIKMDGQLKGRVPEPFDGDRSKTQTFMNAFDLYWMTNEESSVMRIPYRRCTLFLGLLQGPKVEDWVVEQAKELRHKVNRLSDPIAKTEEELWEDLKSAFESAYAHTGRVEQARADLAKLEMAGDQIDEYIAKYENLLKRAEIPRTEVGALEKFREGLKKGVSLAIMRRDTWPTTLDEWEENARREVRRYNIIKEAIGGRTNPFASVRQNKWQEDAKKVFGRRKRNDDPVPMEVDAARTYEPKNQGRQKTNNEQLKKEGRCFKCQKQGHMMRDCPQKDSTPPKDKAPSYKIGGRQAIAEEPKGDETPRSLARRIKELDDNGRDEILQVMMNDTGF
jgi:hypothetical protein